MANNEIKVGLKVDDKGNLKKTAKNAQKAGKALDNTAKSSDKYSKGQKGVAQATANSTKAFSKMQGGMGGMVGVYAEIASRVFALSAAFQFLKSASDVTNLIAGQEALGASTGVAYKTLTKGLKDATDGQISYQAAAKAAAIGTAAGLSPDQLTKLGKAAKNTSIALGRDLGDSFDRLVRGVTKAEPELLDELGIILRLETAKKNYGDSIGVLAKDLNQFQQSQAVTNEVLRQAEEKFGEVGEGMDDSAASLNRFLVSFDTLLNSIKMGVTRALRPVFDFLSGNTLALVAALTLLGKSVLTAILPNFKDMGEASANAMKKANMGVIEHQAHLENVQRKLKATTSAMVAQKNAVTANAQAAFGKTVPTTTKGGGGALDFLMGSSDTKKAQAQADKALKTAESQLKSSLTKRTGMFKHMNAEQLAIMRASYAQRALLIKQEEQVHKGATVGMTGHLKVLQAQALLTFSSMKVALVSFGAKAAAVGMTLMSWMGWVGVILLIGSALHTLYLKLFPISEELERAQNMGKEFTEAGKTLNKELQRMAEFSNKASRSLHKLTSQRGKMNTSAQFKERIEELRVTTKALGIESKQTEALALELETTARILASTVSPEFLVFAKLLKANKGLTEDQGIELIKLSAIFSNFGMAIDELPTKMKAVQTEIDKLTSSSKESNPIMGLQIALAQAADVSKTQLQGLEYTMTNAENKLLKTAEKIGKLKEDLDNMPKPEKPSILAKRGGDHSVKVYRQAMKARALVEEEIKLLKAKEKIEAQFEASKATEITKAFMAHKALLEMQARIDKSSTNIIANQKLANTLLEEEVLLATRGLTIEQKRVNLGLTKNGVEAKYLEALNKQITASNVNASITKADGEIKAANAKARLASADKDLAIAEHLLRVKDEDIRLGGLNLDIEKELLSIAAQKLDIQKEAGQLARDLKSIGSSTYGFEKARLESRQKVLILENKIEAAIQASAETMTKMNAPGQTGAQKAASKAANQKAVDALQMAMLNLKIAKSAGIIQQNELRAEGEITKFKSTSFAWTKQQEAVQKEVLKALQKGIDITPEWLETTKEIVAENDKLTRQYEMQATIKSSMTSGMAQGIAALLKNEEGSFKDSMLVLAEGVLGSIADKLAEQMADDIMGMLFQEETTAQTINAAMLTGAQATGTAITTSTGVGATTIGTAITTACTIGAATLGAAAAASSAAGSVVGVVADVMSSDDRESGMHDVIASLTKEKEQREASPIALPTAGLNPAGLLSGLQGKLGGDGEPATEDTQRKILASLGGEGAGGEGFFGRIKNTFMGLFAGIRGLFKSKGKEDEKKEKGFFKNLWDMFTNLGTWIAALFKSKEGSEEEGGGGNPLSKLTDIFSKKEGADAEGDKNFFAKMGDMIGSMFSKGGDTGGGSGGGGDGGKANIFVKAFSWIAGLFGGGGPPPAARNGGVISMGQKVPGYATGGVARGPGAGYPALLHGTEAVVPLPNGKSIPVDMPQNAGQQNNSVVVNISQDGSADTSDSSGPDMQRLGGAIAKAVQKELQAQKRSGGILSPYGVA